MGRLILIATIGSLSAAAAMAQPAQHQQPQQQQQDKSATDARHDRLSESDRDFLRYAAEDNQAEIQLCLLAEKRAASPAVKAFARLMVADHATIESRLAVLGNDEKFGLPDGIGKEGEQAHSKLSPLHGADFDDAFIKMQIEDHSKDIDKFNKQTSDSQNTGVTRFAAETLPLLKQHLALAHAVQDSLQNR